MSVYVSECLASKSCLLFATLDCSLPGSSVYGILQARILEWVAMPSSRGSSQPRDRTQVSYISCTGRRFFTTVPLEKPTSAYIESFGGFLSIKTHWLARQVCTKHLPVRRPCWRHAVHRADTASATRLLHRWGTDRQRLGRRRAAWPQERGQGLATRLLGCCHLVQQDGSPPASAHGIKARWALPGWHLDRGCRPALRIPCLEQPGLHSQTRTDITHGTAPNISSLEPSSSASPFSPSPPFSLSQDPASQSRGCRRVRGLTLT